MKRGIWILVAVVFVVVIVVGAVAVTTMNSSSNSANQENNLSGNGSVAPVLELSLSTEEENQESVEITAKASTEDSNGIYGITLPDESVKKSDTATYTATKNGTYTFQAEGKNGEKASLTIEVTNIRETSAAEPYIPTGFTHTEGEVDNGFVIQDEYGNEFVWVPVKNGKITRNTASNSDYVETISSASELVNSVAQNYGFYIARYESSVFDKDGETVAASRKDEKPWTNITFQTASRSASKAASAYGYTDYRTALVSSYAWDATLKWIDSSVESYSSSTSYGNYAKEVNKTGNTTTDIVNNICDMAGNVREWTTEIYKGADKPVETNNTNNTSSSNNNSNNTVNEQAVEEQVKFRVIRGGGAHLSRTAKSYNGYKENASDEYWGFRMILYK